MRKVLCVYAALIVMCLRSVSVIIIAYPKKFRY